MHTKNGNGPRLKKTSGDKNNMVERGNFFQIMHDEKQTVQGDLTAAAVTVPGSRYTAETLAASLSTYYRGCKIVIPGGPTNPLPLNTAVHLKHTTWRLGSRLLLFLPSLTFPSHRTLTSHRKTRAS